MKKLKTDERYPREQVQYILGGCLIDGTNRFKNLIRKAFECLPQEIVDFCEENIYFLSPARENRACAFDAKSLKDKWIIVVDSSELAKSDEEIISTIIHEIGHVYLNHRWNPNKSEVTGDTEEKAANNFQKKYFGHSS